MALPQVAQAELLADILAAALARWRPGSVAVLGCAGGNGFERIDPATTRRVVGVDLVPDFVEAVGRRFEGSFAVLELVVGDVQNPATRFAPVDLVYAALLFEYVDPEQVMARMPELLVPGGVLVTVVQRPDAGVAKITPSPYTSLAALASSLHLVDPQALAAVAARHGALGLESHQERSRGGKRFAVQSFRFGER